MRKKRKKPSPLASLAHLLSRLFLWAVFLFLLIFLLQVFAAEGPETFQATIEATYKGAFLVALPLAALMILVAGYQYITAGLDADQVKQAKETVIYALGGLILLVLGYQFLSWLIRAGPGSPLEYLRNINISNFLSGSGGSSGGGGGW